MWVKIRYGLNIHLKKRTTRNSVQFLWKKEMISFLHPQLIVFSLLFEVSPFIRKKYKNKSPLALIHDFLYNSLTWFNLFTRHLLPFNWALASWWIWQMLYDFLSRAKKSCSKKSDAVLLNGFQINSHLLSFPFFSFPPF